MIETHFNIKIPKEVLFVESTIDNCFADYFIPLIDEGVKKEDNCNYWTNLKGQMTHWDYFSKDETFRKLLYTSVRDMELGLPKLTLHEAWGFKVNEEDFTEQHSHKTDYSGIFYLNDSEMFIDFPELKKSVKSNKNKFLFFSGIIMHGTKPLVKGVKYGIAFNLRNNVRK